MLPGRFLVLEGGDATGKTTQAGRLAARLREHGRDVLLTFEPGGTPLGADLRRLLLDGTGTVEPEAEALLMAADRAQHVLEVVRPALARGDWVVSDRFVPSSLAYQGVGRGLGVPAIELVNGIATGGLDPDLVVVLDLPPEVATERFGAARDRLEEEDDAFRLAVHEAYRDLAGTRGWVLLDASGPVEEVADRIWGVVTERLG
ncbi:MAG TPA: dTMP kinase [Acidimicrobiia bacterium]|jgi:dTMP kinase|nr:dTMP kinase [Acidimicrobiia bacterium]